MSTFEKGEGVVITATFTDDAGDPASPQTPIQVKIERPDGTIDGPFAMSSVGPGVYEYVYTAQVTGLHRYQVTTSDSPPAVTTDTFEVIEPVE